MADARSGVTVYSETKTDDSGGSQQTTAVKISPPELPPVIKGDGRYVMTLLRDWLTESTRQINIANGFTQEDIDPDTEGAVQTPRNFVLTFDRLGGQFTWDHIADIANLAYYELRTDTFVGEEFGLLERTVNNYSTSLPVTSVGHVYLYAFDKAAQYSNPAELYYNKPRPDAPTDIAVTKNSEGTLITFSEIPTNCMGAYIYIDNTRYTAYDNVYLITKDLSGIEDVEVAFFDQFGEGERGVLYLVLPDVTGFLVERNGPELDFYWDPMNIYNIKYIVKVCSELSWERGTELFRTATNDKNRRLYPNRGSYYLMVKAYDEHGNYSKNAAYQYMTTETDISRNIILEFDQQDTLYAGYKVNVYYDPSIEGVTLEREASRGEYIFPVSLDQRYKARNWLEYNVITVASGNNLMWQDATMMWKNAHFQWAGVLGNVDSANVKQEIAYKLDEAATADILDADLNGDLLTATDAPPVTAVHADTFEAGRWGLEGLYISQLTKLEYSLSGMTAEFNMAFNLKTLHGLHDTVFAVLTGDSGSLTLGYDARREVVYLTGSDGVMLEVPFTQAAELDCFTFAISQSAGTRTLYFYSLSNDITAQDSGDAAPIGVFNKLSCNDVLV